VDSDFCFVAETRPIEEISTRRTGGAGGTIRIGRE
jgi:hypothetical protein